VPFFEQIEVDYKPGETRDVELHDGSHLRLRKTANDYDPTNRMEALDMLRRTRDSSEFLTGLIYVDEEKPDFLSLLNLVEPPLATLPQEQTQPGPADLDEIMRALM
jgi:2-oxoglutarate ferredoxin oxidoreductase subunit beta